jgi:hypothetical protein
MMRKRVMVMMIAGAGLVLSAATAVGEGPCPPGQVQKCEREPKSRPPRCYCVQAPGPWVPPGGKAEIHQKNVPTVKPNRNPGPND